MDNEFEEFEQCDSMSERVMKLTKNVQILIKMIQQFQITNVKSITQGEDGDILIETYDNEVINLTEVKNNGWNYC